jgi:signal transduction histidine kinase
MSGIEVCEIIKRTMPEVMVLQTSATFTDPQARIRGLNGGADSYLIQPAEPEELAAAVGALLRIRRAEDRLRAVNEKLEERVRERTAGLLALNEELKREIAQRQAAEAALIQSQKMEAVGHLTGGLAHDFNNLLTAIVGNLDLIRRRTNEPNVLRLAENALKAAARGSKLTAQLLVFSRTQKLARRPIDIGALISGMGDMLAQTLGRSIQVFTELAPETGLVWGDDNQLEVAILNLAINARDAMPNGGTLMISAVPQLLETPDGDLKPGKYVRVSIADTGEGMDADTLKKAFDPFFTTKEPGKGTGLGLAQVYGIAKQCGGTARLSSEVGKGTTVSIWLSHADGAEVNSFSSGGEDHDGIHTGAILLIDDDPDVRTALHDLATDMGYSVSAVESGAAAIDFLHATRPDIVLLDFTMPELGGVETAKLIREQYEDLPIVFISGYADTHALAAAVGDNALLRKPFGRDELAAALLNAMRGDRMQAG